MSRLLDILEMYQVGDLDREDEMVWIQDEDRGFSVKSMFEALSIQKLVSSPGICTWNPIIQLKMSFVVWKLWWNWAPYN